MRIKDVIAVVLSLFFLIVPMGFLCAYGIFLFPMFYEKLNGYDGFLEKIVLYGLDISTGKTISYYSVSFLPVAFLCIVFFIFLLDTCFAFSITVIIICLIPSLMSITLKCVILADNGIKGNMMSIFEHYYQNDFGTDPISMGINNMSLKLGCCGIENYTDIYHAKQWNRTFRIDQSRHVTLKIPYFCCKSSYIHSTVPLKSPNLLLDATCAMMPTEDIANLKGCYAAVIDVFKYLLCLQITFIFFLLICLVTVLVGTGECQKCYRKSKIVSCCQRMSHADNSLSLKKECHDKWKKINLKSRIVSCCQKIRSTDELQNNQASKMNIYTIPEDTHKDEKNQIICVSQLLMKVKRSIKWMIKKVTLNKFSG